MASILQLFCALCIILFSLLDENKAFVLAENTCGSLITYRQYSTTLESAPQCFIDGCTTNTKPSSMSATCPSTEPCSELWNLISGEYQQPWCANCTNDIACRIPGWPILNASAVCDITPNTWILGTQGSCCATGNQSFELAQWVDKMCNGSEWRTPFNYYGGMAMLDWEEWLLPWNWTVRAENTSTVTVAPSQCSQTPHALLAFAGENILFLLFAIGLSVLKLVYIHGRQEKWPWVEKFNKFCHPLTYLKFWQWRKKFKKWRQRREGSIVEEEESSLLPPADFRVLWSVLMTGLQVGGNFLSAYLIRRTRGYQHVPIWRLALLFCCRPRLSWLACLLELIGPRTLRRVFNITDQRYVKKAEASLRSIGIGSAFSEFVLQGISSYYMVTTANIGRLRGFYLLHHLRPYWRGGDAQAMYLGALFWLIGCLFIFISWIFAFKYGYQVLKFTHEQLSRLKRRVQRTAEKTWPLSVIFRFYGNNPPATDGNGNQVVHNNANQNEIVHVDPDQNEMVQIDGDRNEVIHDDRDRNELVHSIVGRAGRVPRDGDRNERIPLGQRQAIEGTGGDAGERIELATNSRPQTEQDVRLRGGFNSIQEGDRNERVAPTLTTNDGDRNESVGPIERNQTTPLGAGSGSETLLGNSTIDSQLSSTAVNEGASAWNLMSRLLGTQRPQQERRHSDHSTPEEEIKPEEPQGELPNAVSEHLEWQQLWIKIGLSIGALAWALQWVFWAGFISTAGQRFVVLSSSPPARDPCVM
jgi:hypothetical protein